MKPIPQTENPLIVRADFSNQSVWEQVRAAVQRPVGLLRFRAYVDFLEDIGYDGLTTDVLPAVLPRGYDKSFIMIADHVTMTHREHPLLIIDLFEDSFHEFRALPSQVQGIENNLSIGNMDFDEFAGAAGPDGIFRGF
jgi:hypothetical protein